jgi:aldose 1-epimerase
MKSRLFGKAPSGEEVHAYTLAGDGIEVEIINYGGFIISLSVPNRNGKMEDVVLGYDELDGYLHDKAHFGGIIGRYANRIANGRFTLKGKQYQLAQNNGQNHLHGGPRGFDRVLWHPHAETHPSRGESLQLDYLSKDDEESYPGNLSVTVRYSISGKGELRIDYSATTDADTILNLTNHTYFNFSGAGTKDILNHELMLQASRFTPVNSALIPTGELRSVEGTPFDFRKLRVIGKCIDSEDEQMQFGKGYDLNWVIDGGGAGLVVAAQAYDKASGRALEVRTTEPGIQFYSGNMIVAGTRGKRGETYAPRSGFCLETQHFPDSPNQPQFPSTVLKAGAKFASTTIFAFSVR